MFTKLTDKDTGRELWKEYHLCLICMKWMCLNDHPFVRLRKEGSITTLTNPVFPMT